MRAPDFFIAGAPRCGTTALWSGLRQHPDVFLPDRKEPHFFGSDLVWRRRSRPDLAAYLGLFRTAGPARRVGEASTCYLLSTRAAREIFAFHPGARIVVMLRDPVSVMHSFHSERLFGGNEDIADFAEALDAEPDRLAGRRLPERARLVQACCYRQVVDFASQLERYLGVFGEEAVHVVLHEDFRSDPHGVFRAVCHFLDVDPGFTPAIRALNANKEPRSAALRDWLRDGAGPARRAARRLLPAPLRRLAFRTAWAANARATARAPLPPGLEAKLRIDLAPQVERLGRLLGRDLSAWIEGSG